MTDLPLRADPRWPGQWSDPNGCFIRSDRSVHQLQCGAPTRTKQMVNHLFGSVHQGRVFRCCAIAVARLAAPVHLRKPSEVLLPTAGAILFATLLRVVAEPPERWTPLPGWPQLLIAAPAVVAAVCEFVLDLGPVLAVVPAILVNPRAAPRRQLWAAVACLAIHKIEGNVVIRDPSDPFGRRISASLMRRTGS